MQPQCNCPIDYYTMPNIDFVAGATQDLDFHCFDAKRFQPFELSRCTATFSIVNFLNKRGKPIVSKEMEVLPGNRPEEEEVSNILHVTLDSSDTLNFSGKYVYQLTIKGPNGEVDIPNQGTMYIINNIDKSAAS